MSRTVKKNSLVVSKNRHNWIYAITNNENQGTGDYPLNLLISLKLCYESIRKKLYGHYTAMVAPKNAAHFERYVSVIFDKY